MIKTINDKSEMNMVPRTLKSCCFLAVAMTTVLLGCSMAQAQTVPIEIGSANDIGDLTRMAVSHTEAVRDQKIAQLRVVALESLSVATYVTNLEKSVAQAELTYAKRQVELLNMIVNKELGVARARLEMLEKMEKHMASQVAPRTTPRKPLPQITEAKAVIEILESILATK